MSLDNLRSVFWQADPHDLRDGRLAYRRHHDTLRRLAAHYAAPFDATVGVFCALSPNNDYMGNLRSTATLLEGFRDGASFYLLTVSTYIACAERAWRVLQGEPFLSFTKGKKTRSFYQNIMDPSDPLPVTIDGHMLSIWQGRRMTMKEAVRSRIRYEDVAQGVRELAGEVGVLPNQVQSTLWFTWKRLHRVLYRPQIDLFRPEDPWMLDVAPADVQPFARRG